MNDPVLPCAPDAERSLLGSVLIDGSLLSRVKGFLVPEDFSGEAHRLVYEACLAVAGGGEDKDVDLVTVGAELEKTGMLGRVGGSAALSALVDRVPDVENVESYGRLVAETAARRRLILDLTRRIAAVERGEPDEALKKPESSPWIDLGRFREELRQTTRTRISTKIPTLDRATEGGISGGTVVALVGPVGSVKTALAYQLPRGRARASGRRVYGYSPDQGGGQPLRRLASTFGNVAEDDDAFDAFAAEAEATLRIIDERQDGVTIESFRDLVLAAGDVDDVVIDTPQTVATNDGEEERQRIDKTMGIAREIAEKLQVPVFVCSHANRAATAARKREDRTLERSAGLGSASIEHRAQVVIFMERRDGGDATEVDMVIVKAPVAGLRCRLRLDVGTWTLREIDITDDSAATEERMKKARAEKQDMARAERREAVMAVLLGGPTDAGVSFARIEVRVSGRTADLKAALAVMIEEGLLEEIEGPKGKRGGPRPLHYRLRQAPESGSPDSATFQPPPPTGTDEPEADEHSFPTIHSHENETRERVGNNAESFMPPPDPRGPGVGRNERPVLSRPSAENGKETGVTTIQPEARVTPGDDPAEATPSPPPFIPITKVQTAPSPDEADEAAAATTPYPEAAAPPLLIAATPAPCYACGGTSFWFTPAGNPICARCHPPVDPVPKATPPPAVRSPFDLSAEEFFRKYLDDDLDIGSPS